MKNTFVFELSKYKVSLIVYNPKGYDCFHFNTLHFSKQEKADSQMIDLICQLFRNVTSD